jgi:hypothetical protein
MAAVYVNNIVVNSGSDFTQSFTLEGAATNSAFNLTGYTVTSQMRKWSGSSSAVDFTTTIEYPPTQGKLLIRLNAIQTSALKPGRYVYDVLITDEFGIKNRVIEGMALVTEGVTR